MFDAPPRTSRRWERAAALTGVAVAVVAAGALIGVAVTVALAYGVGIAVTALRGAAHRRRASGPERSASSVGPDGRLVWSGGAAEAPAPPRTV